MRSAVAQSYDIVPLTELEQHPANPRRGNVETIGESIEANGFYGAVIVQASTRRVLAGNHRVQAALTAGMTEIPALVIDVDDETAKRILLVDNRSNDVASYDERALLDLLADLGDLTGSGYVLDDLAALQRSLEHDAAELTDTAAQLAAGNVYTVIVEARDEAHQARLLEQFDAEGLTCRPFTV